MDDRYNMMKCDECGHIFNIRDGTVVYVSRYGTKIRDLVCPICHGKFRAVEIPPDLDKYLFVNDDERYYKYNKGEN